MLRYLLIVTLIIYVLNKLGFFRGLFEGASEQNYRKPPNGNVNVDSAPKKERKRGDIDGGEYIDYEEVK